MKKSVVMVAGIVIVLGLFTARALIRRSSTPTDGQPSSAMDPEAYREYVRSSLQEGDSRVVVPTVSVNGEGTSLQPILHRIDSGTGFVVLYGTVTAIEGDTVTVDTTEGVETVTLTPETTVFEVPPAGDTQARDLDYLRGLTLPVTSEVSLDINTRNAISVTVYRTK